MSFIFNVGFEVLVRFFSCNFPAAGCCYMIFIREKKLGLDIHMERHLSEPNH